MKALSSTVQLTFTEVKALFCAKEGYELFFRKNSKGTMIFERRTPKGICDNKFIISAEHKFAPDIPFRFEESEDSTSILRVYFCRPAKIVEWSKF